MFHFVRDRLVLCRIMLSLLCSGICAASLNAQMPQTPATGTTDSGGDTPAKFEPKRDTFEYTTREVKIPMRDGVKLDTFIVVPKGAKNAPMLLDRTPYHASARVARRNSPHMNAVLSQMNDSAVASGYIIVYQDVRGKY